MSNVIIAEYSWEYNGYKYTFKEAAVKSSFYKAEEFCKSQGGEIPFFEYEKHEVKKSVLVLIKLFLFSKIIKTIYYRISSSN